MKILEDQTSEDLEQPYHQFKIDYIKFILPNLDLDLANLIKLFLSIFLKLFCTSCMAYFLRVFLHIMHGIFSLKRSLVWLHVYCGLFDVLETSERDEGFCNCYSYSPCCQGKWHTLMNFLSIFAMHDLEYFFICMCRIVLLCWNNYLLYTSCV